MNVRHASVDGALIVEADRFMDHRGTFFEVWNRERFIKHGLPFQWPQDNFSTSHKNVVRGLHIQRKNPQGKLVFCPEGEVLDFCLDLRPDSPTFKKIHAEQLYGSKALYLPPGTAHGFLALAPRNVVLYKCTTLYDAETDGGVNFFDDALDALPEGIRRRAIRSLKDQNLPSLGQWLADPRGTYVERR